MGSLLKVMHWHIENIQAQQAQFVALAVFSAIAKSNLKNKKERENRQNYHILIVI